MNLLSELDAPGEFYVDRDNSKIYFWPPAAITDTDDTIVSVLDYAIKMDNVSNVNFEGLLIEGTRKEVRNEILSELN